MSEPKSESCYVDSPQGTLLQITIEEVTYSFNAEWVPKDMREGFRSTLHNKLVKAFQLGVYKTKQDIRDFFNSKFGTNI